MVPQLLWLRLQQLPPPPGINEAAWGCWPPAHPCVTVQSASTSLCPRFFILKSRRDKTSASWLLGDYTEPGAGASTSPCLRGWLAVSHSALSLKGLGQKGPSPVPEEKLCLKQGLRGEESGGC